MVTSWHQPLLRSPRARLALTGVIGVTSLPSSLLELTVGMPLHPSSKQRRRPDSTTLVGVCTGVNSWTATAAQHNAGRVALRILDWQADQYPILIAVLAYEARGRKIHQALQYATALGLMITEPPPQGAIRGCAKIKPLFEYTYSAGAMRQEGGAPLMPDTLAHCPETMVLVDPDRQVVLPGWFSARMPEHRPLPHPWNRSRGPEYDMYASGIDLDPGPSAREHVERQRQARKANEFKAQMEHAARKARRARRAHPYLWGGIRTCMGSCTPMRN